MSDPLLFEKRDGGAYVTFNRPDVRNAVTADMLADLADMLVEVEADEGVRYLVFQGAGEHFSAGGDVRGFEESLALAPSARRRSFERRLIRNSDPFLLLGQMNVPIVSIVRGAVAGAGLVFVLAADLAFASEEAVFVFAHAHVGLSLDLGMSYFLPRVVGWKQAKSLALSSAKLSAQQALHLGMINEVLPAGDLQAHAKAAIGRLAKGPRHALRETKRLLSHSLDHSLADQLVMEARAVGGCVENGDFVEGVSAFLERRKPDFRKG